MVYATPPCKARYRCTVWVLQGGGCIDSGTRSLTCAMLCVDWTYTPPAPLVTHGARHQYFSNYYFHAVPQVGIRSHKVQGRQAHWLQRVVFASYVSVQAMEVSPVPRPRQLNALTCSSLRPGPRASRLATDCGTVRDRQCTSQYDSTRYTSEGQPSAFHIAPCKWGARFCVSESTGTLAYLR
jgi:hypothetical protein